jgi:hypothetical protein
VPEGAIPFCHSLYLDESIRRLREEGEVADVAPAPASPLSHSHVNMFGRYSFELDESLTGGGLRPLRDPAKTDGYELFVAP